MKDLVRINQDLLFWICVYVSRTQSTRSQIIQIAVKNQHTQQHPTPNMDGKNSSVNDCILLIIAIMVFQLGLLGTTIFLDQKEPGKVVSEKAPAAICRKVAELPEEGGTIEVWGDGEQTRSFLYIDECIEATRRMMDSDFIGPVNIGSEEMVTINQLVDTAAKVAGKVC
jgi:hypothetical protein